jgi:hypothetical protein
MHMSTLKGFMTTFGVNKMDSSILIHVFFRRIDEALELRDIVLDFYAQLYNYRGVNTGPRINSGDVDADLEVDSVDKSWHYGSPEFLLQSADYFILFAEFDKFFQSLSQCKFEKEHNPSTLAGKYCHLTSVLHYPGLLNCQCKMVLGFPCAEKLFFPYTKIDVDSKNDGNYIIRTDIMNALRDNMYNNFKFSGVQERWNETIHKFHTKYGGNYFQEENYVTRQGNAQFKEARKYIEAVYEKEHTSMDKCDNFLYMEAEKWLDSQPF